MRSKEGFSNWPENEGSAFGRALFFHFFPEKNQGKILKIPCYFKTNVIRLKQKWRKVGLSGMKW